MRNNRTSMLTVQYNRKKEMSLGKQRWSDWIWTNKYPSAELTKFLTFFLFWRAHICKHVREMLSGLLHLFAWTLCNYNLYFWLDLKVIKGTKHVMVDLMLKIELKNWNGICKAEFKIVQMMVNITLYFSFRRRHLKYIIKKWYWPHPKSSWNTWARF